jgi:hypothetical protein
MEQFLRGGEMAGACFDQMFVAVAEHHYGFIRIV